MINMFKRVFLIVLDGVGIGEADDAYKFGDEGASTLEHTLGERYNLDVLEKLGLTILMGKSEENTRGLYMIAKPKNMQKDSLNGHYEIMCAIKKKPYQTYPEGFPPSSVRGRTEHHSQ